MKVLWIGGWGTYPQWGLTAVRRWRPDWDHEWITPGPGCEHHADGSHDWVGGYSFGAFLMLCNIDAFPAKKGRFYVAPFLDLKREAGLGGLLATTQLKVTRRWLKRDATQAVSDFYKRAGLNIKLQDELPYALNDLIWGIETLLGASAPLPDGNPGYAVFGSKDPLIDSNVTKQFFPMHTVREGSGHRLESLRAALNLG